MKVFTHPTFANEKEVELSDYQRLEFLGDAVLEFIVTVHIFRKFPNYTEGELTDLRKQYIRYVMS
jgi:ribonuclease-3